MSYISVKPCPVCGEPPEKTSYDLGRPGGHGYPGHKSFQYKCEFCQLVKGGDCDDIYCSTEEAQNRAKRSWNSEVERIQNHLRRTASFD